MSLSNVSPNPMLWALVHHLWQSTIFCQGVWLLTLVLRKNRASARFRLWMLASLKFLLPFALLISAGEALRPANSTATSPAVFTMMVEGTPQYIDDAVRRVDVDTTHRLDAAASTVPDRIRQSPVLTILIGAWLSGSVLLAMFYMLGWRRIRTQVKSATPHGSYSGIPFLITSQDVEPGVFGILRPVLLLPSGIMGRLSPEQMQAILAHELCHVRRRDNLVAALHMIAQVLFWFHPMVWWIGARMMDEREAACDAAVLASSNDAHVYAEGILQVCKFYVATPTTLVAGVTGADLKQRIQRIISHDFGSTLSRRRKLLITALVLAGVAAPLCFGVLHTKIVHAAQAVVAKNNIDDTWQGTLHVPQRDFRIVLKVEKGPDGALKSSFYSIDQDGQPISVKQTKFIDGQLNLSVDAIGGEFAGKMSPDGTTITGDWKQGDKPFQLILVRTTPETAWTIPEPPKKVPPMAADADPSYEVATVKLTPAGFQGKGFGGPPGTFNTRGTTVTDLIMFAYRVHTKQILNGPDWMDTIQFDITGKPDTPGQPNEKQKRLMMQKLLASRFGLKYHDDKKELSAFILTVAKGGPKLEKSEADADSPQGFGFRALGDLVYRNITMPEFAVWLQTVLDRPVVDRTELPGRFDGKLKWNPDETQFAVFGPPPHPSTAPDAPPDLYKAIQEQIGLKLDAAKVAVPVMVLDHVEKPSDN